MKNLKIKKEFIKLLNENEISCCYSTDYEICCGATFCLDIRKFRFLCHSIINLLTLEENHKNNLHNEISNNNFTNLILLEILEVI